ncbi:MAG TPA: RDD family protein [Thermoanaerobaculia bacterium]|nr:RDD family protein [Thermoanaerobaculia bacterium]
MICANHADVSEAIRRCARCAIPYCSDCLVDIAGRPYCANCKQQQLLDVRSGVVRGQLDLATVGKRFGAVFLDWLIIAIPMYAVMAVLIFIPTAQGREPSPFVNLIGLPFAFLSLLYEGLMMQYKNGQTLGKMALRIRVVRPDGTPMSTGQAWGRAGMKVLFGCIWFVDYLVALFTDERTTLHDMVAGTRVVNS